MKDDPATTTAHRHKFVSYSPYRVCSVCRAVQRKVGGRWVKGTLAANPTEQKNIARRVLPNFEKCARCGADALKFCKWDSADGWWCLNCGACDSDE